MAKSNKCILIIPDLHCPWEHPDAVSFLRAVKRKYKPTRVVCLGDEQDGQALSFHESNPDLPSAGDELAMAIEHLRPLYSLFPSVDVIDSNHGSLAYRRAHAAGMPKSMIRPYGEVLGAPKGWNWTHDLTLTLPGGNECYFHHGLSSNIMQVVTQRGVCVVQGHFHGKFSIGYAGNPDKLIFGLQSGCLVDRAAMAFAYDRNNLPRPIIGCSLIRDGLPILIPMTLEKGGRWNGKVP